MDLTIIIPSFNEEVSLPILIPKLIDYCKNNNVKAIIVDDGSTDDSSTILSQYTSNSFIKILKHKVNKGYGAAIKTGIAKSDTEYIVTLDADLQHNMEYISKFYNIAVEDDYDLLIGKRKNENKFSYRAIGKFLIRNIANYLIKNTVYDLNSGFKLYKTSLAQRYFCLLPDNMAYSDIITLVFLNYKHLVKEIDIEINERKFGTSTIRTRTAFETIYEIINIIMLFNPIRIFLPLSLLLLFLGILWGIPILLSGRGLSVGASMFVINGVLMICIGLIAEQLSSIRKSMVNEE